MKGIISTLAILMLFLAIFILAIIFSTESSEQSEIPIANLILDRVYNKFSSIEYNIQKILDVEAYIGGVDVTIEENDFNTITFSEVLPRRTDTSEFSEDLANFEKFAEEKLIETNLVVDLDFTDLKCLPLVISPYNITYEHLPSDCEQQPAQTEVLIDPKDSWQYLDSYTLVFEPDGNIADADITGWSGPGCNKGTLKLVITIIGNDVTLGPYSTTTDYGKMCKFNIDQISCPSGLGFVHVIHNSESRDIDKGMLSIQVHENCNIKSTVSLKLVDIPGKVGVNLPAQSIKVKETLYQIEKNDTVHIVGD